MNTEFLGAIEPSSGNILTLITTTSIRFPFSASCIEQNSWDSTRLALFHQRCFLPYVVCRRASCHLLGNEPA